MSSRTALLTSLVYTGASLAAAGVFLAATFATGDGGCVARLGGSAWVFLLSMIILMPTVTPWLKRRLSGQR